ncbi:MAG TPA: FMN-binding protein [Clostridia bacterium]|nr:FMN-binding protein [Clostridia bacterium]
MKKILFATLMVAMLICGSLSAETLLTEAQALKIVFPKSQTVERDTKSLTGEQRQKLQQSTRLRFPEQQYTFYVAKSKGQIDGHALVLDEIGKHENITFIVGVSPKGEVLEVAVMEYRESRGGEVKEQRFLRQFHGKKQADEIAVNKDIMNYTGATLSSHAIARGVKRALALVDTFYGTSK